MSEEHPRCRLCGKPSEGEHKIDAVNIGANGEGTDVKRPICNACYETLVKSKLCPKCKKNLATGLHGCPYAEEVNNNTNPEYCTCCKECEQVCADEV